ncbi:MAG TPA: hypothetical protein VGR26_18490 [Acidimicrobiales bacterium]|nr:hypothetical protein [Acidimicrobiales bacterium]
MRRPQYLSLVVLATVSAACGGGDQGPDQSTGRYGNTHQALCQASEAARRGDAEAAERVFFDRAHQPLHQLAAEVSDIDRTVAARLHEAKAATEAGLNGDDNAEALARLTDATRASLEAIDHPTPPPCRQGE